MKGVRKTWTGANFSPEFRAGRDGSRMPLTTRRLSLIPTQAVPAGRPGIGVHSRATWRDERELSPEARLQFHQAQSGSTMAKLQACLARQFEARLVEPNSSLGRAISYMLKHWEKLTLFLRVPGAPLDNNICERALKKAILHRKNALFYKTENGAHVGDIYMSLIYTCELCDANPLDYLTEIERHAGELALRPEHWMPWNYRSTLPGISAAR